MKILLLEDDETIRERVTFALESQFSAEIVHASTPDEVRKKLKDQNAGINLLVIDSDKSKMREAEKLKNEFTNIQSLVFYHGEGQKPVAISAPPGRPVPVYVDRTNILPNLIAAMTEMVQKGQVPNPEGDQNHCQIRTKLLLSVCPLESDIYIRLSEAKYVKLFRKGDVFDLQDMEKYTVKKGVEFLYLRKKDLGEFVKKFQNELNKYLASKVEITMGEAMKLNDQALETIQELGASVGFNGEVQELAKTQVQIALKAMGKSPSMAKIFEQLQSYQGQYIAAHSTVCGYLACSIASKMKWGSEATFYKLTLAAYLHDITLKNHDLAECENLSDVEAGEFTDEEKRAYGKHMITAAEVSKNFSEVPPDVDIIIAQHHEKPNGTGFPRGLTGTYISPLSSIFIVAHDLARFIKQKGAAFKLIDFLNVARDKYTTSQFRKVVQAIEQLELEKG